jgi:flagellar hook-basal body complex protein FliE
MIIPPVGGLGVELSIGSAEGLAHGGQSGAAGAAAGGEASGFGGELTEAISSLEKTQDSAASASQALAAGTASDPESAVVTVEDAQLAMELASQIRTKATEATQNIFQTQV